MQSKKVPALSQPPIVDQEFTQSRPWYSQYLPQLLGSSMFSISSSLNIQLSPGHTSTTSSSPFHQLSDPGQVISVGSAAEHFLRVESQAASKRTHKSSSRIVPYTLEQLSPSHVQESPFSSYSSQAVSSTILSQPHIQKN